MENMEACDYNQRTQGNWTIRIALDNAYLTRKRVLLPLLKEIEEVKTKHQSIRFLVLSSRNYQQFNAIEQLSLLLMGQSVLNFVHDEPHERKLYVFVPRPLSIELAVQEMEKRSISSGISFDFKIDEYNPLPAILLSSLVKTTLMYEFQAAGFMVFGNGSEKHFVLQRQLQNGQVPVILERNISVSVDGTSGQFILTLTCVPYVMKLQTLANNTGGDIDMEDDKAFAPSVIHSNERVKALPKLSDCWVISHHNSFPTIPSTARMPGSFVPQNEAELRQYWAINNGIKLPIDIGGYVTVRFSSQVVMTYPACCVSSEWSVLYKQTRVESLQVLRNFVVQLRDIYGVENVEVQTASLATPKPRALIPTTTPIDTTKIKLNYSPMLAQSHAAPGPARSTGRKRSLNIDHYSSNSNNGEAQCA